MPNDHDPLTPAVEALRADVPLRPEWRAAVLDAVAREPRPDRAPPRRGILLTPSMAAAAAAAFLVLGAIGGALLARRDELPVPTIAFADSVGARGVASSDSRPIRFEFTAPSARHVTLVGDFNGWDPMATPLERRRSDGTWSITLPLAAGRHVYAFVVDGGLRADPRAARAPEDDFGSPNSVILVSGRAR
jgi:hypothetical protein